MASISYLWKNRAKFPLFTFRFFKAWAKRLVSSRELLTRNRRRGNLRSSGAKIASTAEIGEVDARGKISLLSVGAFSSLGRVELALHDEITIKNYVCINDGVKLLTASHKIDDPSWIQIKKSITIDDYAWIATSAIILPGVRIGKGAVVGAGAVVSKDVQDYEIVVGNPARPINKKRNSNLTYNPCEFLAANNAWLKG